jgi:DegV family protein with EDD domain
MSKIGLVTDSTADIPGALLEKYTISVVPNLIIVNGKSLKDGLDISREKFYRELPEMSPLPTTSTASSGAFKDCYKKLFQAGIGRIISIHAASMLSGIFNTARIAAQSFDQRVDVIDSQSITLGLGFQVLAAAEAIARGESFESILGAIESVHKRVEIVAMLDTLEYVRRSGRVSWARARMGDLLRVKPFVGVRMDGQISSLGEARTRKKGIKRLYQFLNELGPLERLAILHTNAEEEAQQMLSDFLGRVSTRPLLVNITTVIGTHVGPNGLGFSAVVK